MASQAAADAGEEKDDDESGILPSSAGTGNGFRFGLRRPAASSNGGGGSLLGRMARSPSPAFTRNIIETAPVNHFSSAGRPSLSVHTAPMVPPAKTTLQTHSSYSCAVEPPHDRHRDKRCLPRNCSNKA